jgi:hypothetical protein
MKQEFHRTKFFYSQKKEKRLILKKKKLPIIDLETPLVIWGERTILPSVPQL